MIKKKVWKLPLQRKGLCLHLVVGTLIFQLPLATSDVVPLFEAWFLLVPQETFASQSLLVIGVEFHTFDWLPLVACSMSQLIVGVVISAINEVILMQPPTFFF